MEQELEAQNQEDVQVVDEDHPYLPGVQGPQNLDHVEKVQHVLQIEGHGDEPEGVQEQHGVQQPHGIQDAQAALEAAVEGLPNFLQQAIIQAAQQMAAAMADRLAVGLAANNANLRPQQAAAYEEASKFKIK